MVVDHGGGLHVGVDDGGSDEGEAAGFEVFGDGIGEGRYPWWPCGRCRRRIGEAGGRPALRLRRRGRARAAGAGVV